MRHPFTMALLAVAGAAILSGVPGRSLAADEVSKVVAVRGKAVIEREKAEREARVNDGIRIVDHVATRDASRLKMLFVDESVLTLGEKSRLSVREYVSGKEGKGRSIFNLLDGKMRSVVGKSTFEVHTPTAVAAARGTVILFHAGSRDGKRFTVIQSVEGTVGVSSASPGIAGTVELGPGMTITVFENEPLPSPSPGSASDLLSDTDITRDQILVFDPGPKDLTIPGGAGGTGGPEGGGIGELLAGADPGVPRQPLGATGLSPVTANIVFP